MSDMHISFFSAHFIEKPNMFQTVPTIIRFCVNCGHMSSFHDCMLHVV